MAKRIRWPDGAKILLERLWWEGISAEELEIHLKPFFDKKISATTIRGMASSMGYTRSPDAIREIRTRVAHAPRKPRSKVKTEAVNNEQFAQAMQQQPEQNPKLSVPYQGLATSGPDPNKDLRIKQMQEGRKGRL